MKTSPSYPTRHPHWIDVDPETELEKNKLKARFIKMGLSFKWAFLIVVGFHVILLFGIYATSSLKPKAPHPTAAVETPTATPQGPKSDALARNEWPQPDATPEVKALPPAPKKVAGASKPAPVACKPVERMPSKPTPAKAVAVAVPKTTAPPAPKPGEAALKETFLAAKNTAPHTKADAEVQERVPVSASPQPVVAESTPSPAPAKTVATTPPPAPVSEYTLSSGDNLYAVSRRLQVTYSELMEANGIIDPRQLRIGQKLKVPARGNDSTCAL